MKILTSNSNDNKILVSSLSIASEGVLDQDSGELAYHYTPENSIRERFLEPGAGEEIGAGYFASDKSIADARSKAFETQQGVIGAYRLNVKNPIGTVDVGYFGAEDVIDGIVVYHDEEELLGMGISQEDIEDVKNSMSASPEKANLILTEWLESKGFDGLVFENIDEYRDTNCSQGVNCRTIVPLRPNQISIVQ